MNWNVNFNSQKIGVSGEEENKKEEEEILEEMEINFLELKEDE